MTEPRAQVPADIGPPSDPDALPEEIEAIGAGTADAVATELDVNAQASSVVAGLQDTATTTYRSRPPATWALVAVVAVVTVVTWALSRRRNR